MVPQSRIRRALLSALALALAAAPAAAPAAAQRLTSPEAQFGHPIGADYVLPNYRQLSAYWERLAAESDRMTLVDIGRTAEGRTQRMAIVTSPANHARLDRLREISRTLAMGRVDSAAAAALASEGRAVVWIDGGLHATEVLGPQQLMETVWQLVSRNDPETLRILDDVVVLTVHANPDGMDLVSDWYMREPVPEARSTAFLPRLYQKYIGHDNNRDFYASTQAETENMNRVMYREWFPQIVYNHHQTGPTGTVMFAPPFRDPFNYLYDPLVMTGIDMVGAAMHNRFISEEKEGVTTRRGANYSTWWNGGLRTTTYFHNMIGLLTETIGHPNPFHIPFVPSRQLPSSDLVAPVDPQLWHFRSSVDYSVTANYAVLDYASRYRPTLLTNFWRMGRNSIERGRGDAWTAYPRYVDSVRAVIAAERRETEGDGNAVMSAGGLFRGAAGPEASARYLALLRSPAWRDPRGYVIPAGQADFATAAKFVNALLETGVEVHRATAPFSAAGQRYPEGSFVVRADQPFRPHVLDMFEPQDHPNDFLYEGGPPIPPYDNAGWTLAFQMGVEFDRVMEGFDGPFELVEAWNVAPPPGRIDEPRWNPRGFTLSPRQNDAFTAVNRLLAGGASVSRVERGGDDEAAGEFWVEAGSVEYPRLRALVDSLGIHAGATRRRPSALAPLRAPRIGLWDRYGGSMPSGWTRWILEQFGFPYEVVFAPELDAGSLNERFDVLVFVTGAIPEQDREGGSMAGMPPPEEIPAELRDRLGVVTVERTVPRLREFLENGGTVVTIGSSTVLAAHLGLPVENHLARTAPGGVPAPLPREEYYVPGSVLQVAVDSTAPVARGMATRADVMFDRSPVFRLGEGAEAAGIRRVAWFDSPRPLRSGWAWGQHHLEGGVAVASAPVGRGMLHLFGPEIAFRAQPHGTFPLLFNALFDSVARAGR